MSNYKIIMALYSQARALETRYWIHRADNQDVVWAWDALHARAVHYGYKHAARIAKIKADRWAREVR